MTGRSTPLAFDRIESLGDLREHLQCAIELEHSTLPPYLCAVYSIDRQRNPDAVQVLSSVFIEEMLHLTLAANLLNALGGRPRLDHPSILPGFPRSLPHGDPTFAMSLLPFGRAALAQLLTIERPAPLGAPAQADAYDTIGQFYDAIRRGLLEVCTELGEAAVFCGAPARQVTPEFSYGGAGRVIAVHDLDSALAALGEIVEQGEGASRCQVWDGDHDMFHPERDEVGHYYRLEELRVGRRFRRGDTPQTGPSGEPIGIDWDGVRRMQVNQRIADRVPGDPIRTAQEAFNSSYCRLLALLDSSFNGHPELLGAAVGGMYDLKRQAEELIRMPTGNGFTAGPTFEYVAPERR